jgi:hypothetical protein
MVALYQSIEIGTRKKMSNSQAQFTIERHWKYIWLIVIFKIFMM